MDWNPLIIDRNRLKSIHFRRCPRAPGLACASVPALPPGCVLGSFWTGTTFRNDATQSPAMIVCHRPAAGVLKAGGFPPAPGQWPPATGESPIVSMTPSKRTCPLCETRKAKRFCPAKQVRICPVCCGKKREVEIDCPADCVYLHSGREYERARRARLGAGGQLTERLWSRAFRDRNLELITGLWAAIDQSRSQSPALVDADVREVLERLLRTYRTLEVGLYYDHVPDTLNQQFLYESMKYFLEQRQNPEDLSASSPKTGDVLDCLQMTLEMANLSDSSRPRSREFLDRISAMVLKSTGKPPPLEDPPGIVLP